MNSLASNPSSVTRAVVGMALVIACAGTACTEPDHGEAHVAAAPACASAEVTHGQTRLITCVAGTCTCVANGQVVDTCATTAPDACAADHTCCDFGDGDLDGGTGGGADPDAGPGADGGMGGGGGGGGGGSGTCAASTAVDGQTLAVRCDLAATHAACTCSRNGAVIATCTTTPSNACQLPGGCCPF